MKTRSFLLIVAAAAAILAGADIARAQQSYQMLGTGSSPCGPMGQPQYYTPACEEAYACDTGCGGCDGGSCGCGCCCTPGWHISAEFLYLRPRDLGIEYAVPVQEAEFGSVQMGRTGVMDSTFKPGYRVSVGLMGEDCTSVTGTYTHFQSDSANSITMSETAETGNLLSMVMHPNTVQSLYGWTDARADMRVLFDLADLDYRQVFLSDDRYCVSFLLGGRYASLKQKFGSTFTIAEEEEDPIIAGVNSDVFFEGGGIRLGLEGEGRTAYGVFGYAKAYASLLGGQFRATYLQDSNEEDSIPVSTEWKQARFVPILDAELGVGWQSPGGRVRASAGYTVSGWLNMVKAGEFISSVQVNHYQGLDKLGDTPLTFDGFVTHAEVVW